VTRPSRRMPPSGRSLLRPLQALRMFKRRVGTQRPETDLRIRVSPQPQVVGTEKLRALRCRRVMADSSPGGHLAGRHELTLAECIAPLLPARETRGTYYPDHRRVLNGMPYRHATGCAWRDLPPRYGPWSTVASPQRRWTHEKYLVPFFGDRCLKDINTELIQRFVASLKIAPKSVRNIYVTLQIMRKSARAWGYVAHDAVCEIVFPSPRRSERFFFTLEEVQKILAGAEEAYRTFYWPAAEIGLRAGELCGLRVDDLDFDRRLLRVEQSSWRGNIQQPKTVNSVRSFAISPGVSAHLREFLSRWRPNSRRLIFSTRNGTPWHANVLVKRKLQPLLERLGIRRCGPHAFRHANETLVDRLGVPLKVRQQRLGHSDPRLTLGVYTHVASEDDDRIAGQLGRILHPFAPNEKGKGPVRIEQALVN
jgi:integrase